MAYTHYWDIKEAIPLSKWKLIAEDFNLIEHFCNTKGIMLSGVGITSDYIIFNGQDPYEDFCIYRKVLCSDFCKTGKRPYDLAVVLVLCSVKLHAPDCIELFTDGGDKVFTESVKVLMDNLYPER